MGLIKEGLNVIGAGIQGLNGAFQSGVWKEYFESGSFSEPGVVMKRAHKIVGANSKNVQSDDNLISSGSGIDVQNGECAVIVDNGAIVDFVAVPGRYTFDISSAPSLYAGENKGLKAFGKEILQQWAAGGQRFTTQRIYFIRLTELKESPVKWGAGNIPFHHTYSYRAGTGMLELDIELMAHGTLTLRIEDPVLFFQNYGSKVTGGDNRGVVTIKETGLEENIKSGAGDFVSSALSDLSYEIPMSYTEIMRHRAKVVEYINTNLTESKLRSIGIVVADFNVDGGFKPTAEYLEQIKDLQNSFNLSQNMDAANINVQTNIAQGIKAAGQNGGAAGLMGIGLGMGAVGGGGLGQMQQQYRPQPTQQAQPIGNQGYVGGAATPVAPASPTNTWTCSCGTVNDGNFCKSCGTKKPEPVVEETWTCSCGTVNNGNFCKNCGSKRPEPHKHFRCDKCGWEGEAEDDLRFCPNCGDPVTDADLV